MAAHETVTEYTKQDGDYVDHVRFRRTDHDKYPSGWDDALHYGTIDGITLLRYHNAHERTNGHERHTDTGVEEIDFPGMGTLLERFHQEVDELPP